MGWSEVEGTSHYELSLSFWGVLVKGAFGIAFAFGRQSDWLACLGKSPLDDHWFHTAVYTLFPTAKVFRRHPFSALHVFILHSKPVLRSFALSLFPERCVEALGPSSNTRRNLPECRQDGVLIYSGSKCPVLKRPAIVSNMGR